MNAVQEAEPATEELQYLPVANIAPKEGFNPRKFFADSEFKELKASIKEEGVLQAIVVRPNPDKPGHYWIVVGERRWRAARDLRLDEIPAMVRQMSEAQAFAAAIIENTHRDNMSPAEEARAAHRVVSEHDGDKEAARRQLGWSKTLFDNRLLLLHACDAVLDALENRSIKTGHAELLASLPKETQEGTLEKILEHGVTVAELKAKVDSFSLELRTAIFDLAGCEGCSYNSDMQRGLFEDAISSGRCLNHSCFNDKTQKRLQQIKTELEDKHNAVYLDTEKSPDTYTPLQRSGTEGVGAKQFAACQGCADFGCLVSSRPGEEGQITTGLCFNLTCNKDKVKAYQDEVKAMQDTPAQTTTPGATSPSTQTTSAPAAKSAPKAKANATPKRVIEQARKAITQAGTDVAASDPKISRALLLAALVDTCRVPKEAAKGISPHSKTDGLRTAYHLCDEDLRAVQSAVVRHLTSGNPGDGGFEGESVRISKAILGLSEADMAEHFQVNEDFLKAHTLDGLRSLLTDAEFDAWYNKKQDSDEAFDKLMKKKKSDVIDTVLNRGKNAQKEGFDFKGFVPEVVRKELKGG